MLSLIMIKVKHVIYRNVDINNGRFPGGSYGKKSTCQFRTLWRPEFDPWVGKILWRRKWEPTPVFLPGQEEFWWAAVHGVIESDTTE